MRRAAAFRELSGGLGDAGLLIPVAVAMVTLNGLNATAVFTGVGLLYVATALYYRVPVPVQPLKAFAAAAIALGLGAEEIAAGALWMAAIMGVLALTGLAGWLTARFPTVLVRGIQASVALLLLKAAVDLASRGNWDGLAAIDPVVSFALAVAALALLWASRGRELPGALIVLGGGVIAGLIAGGFPALDGAGPQAVSVSIPGGAAFAAALGSLVVAQVPLTFGNAVVATADAAHNYWGEAAVRVRPNRLAGSIAAGNLLGGLTAGMPVCHGAGGVTAHRSMGARSYRATLYAGVLFAGAGLALGASLPALLQVLAPGALAGMLAFVAIEHGLLAAQLERRDDLAIAGTVGVVTLVAGNLAIGFGAGVALLGLRALVMRGRRVPAEPLLGSRAQT